MILGQPAHVTATLRNEAGELANAGGPLELVVTKPSGVQLKYKGGEISHPGTGSYFVNVPTDLTGPWHYRWLDEGQAVDEGTFTVESEWDQAESPDLTDLRVLVPRARRKVEGPWGNANGRPPLLNSEIYAMVADACGEVVMLSGSVFGHKLEVKERDPLVGYPTAWKTDKPLEEYEAAVIIAQTALDYYFHLFKNFRTQEAIKNEGTEWTWQLSANVIRDYLKTIVEERDHAIKGLRINKPVLDRFSSNIRVRDQATVAVLEWWSGQFDQSTAGGLPGGQEASVVPVFYPPGI